MQLDILTAFSDNYIYLLRAGTAVAVVDPGQAQPVLDALESSGGPLDLILITHGHLDHTAGCDELVQRTGCRVVGPPSIVGAGHGVADGDRVSFADTQLAVLAVPGHTPESLAFTCTDADAALVGDTVFAGGCGRIQPGAAGRMWSSLMRLRELPGDPLICGGHDYTVDNLEFAAYLQPDYAPVAERLASEKAQRDAGASAQPSRLSVERETNPFLRCDDPALARAIGKPGLAPVEVFAEIRRMKDRW